MGALADLGLPLAHRKLLYPQLLVMLAFLQFLKGIIFLLVFIFCPPNNSVR